MQRLRNSPTCVIFALLCASAPLAVPLPAAAQSWPPSSASAASPVPTYDVMAIKPNNSASGNVDIDTDNDRFSATNVSLKQLLGDAYDIRQDLISGLSGPVEAARFDIEAKIVDPDPAALKKMTTEQERTMLLPLLMERFQLKVHTETKPFLSTTSSYCRADRSSSCPRPRLTAAAAAPASTVVVPASNSPLTIFP